MVCCAREGCLAQVFGGPMACVHVSCRQALPVAGPRKEHLGGEVLQARHDPAAAGRMPERHTHHAQHRHHHEGGVMALPAP